MKTAIKSLLVLTVVLAAGCAQMPQDLVSRAPQVDGDQSGPVVVAMATDPRNKMAARGSR